MFEGTNGRPRIMENGRDGTRQGAGLWSVESPPAAAAERVPGHFLPGGLLVLEPGGENGLLVPCCPK